MTNTAERRVEVAVAHPAFEGHFPGRPIWPGVMLLAELFEAVRADGECAARLGPTPTIVAAKFLAPVLPGDSLSIHLADSRGGVRFEIRRGATAVARGELAR